MSFARGCRGPVFLETEAHQASGSDFGSHQWEVESSGSRRAFGVAVSNQRPGEQVYELSCPVGKEPSELPDPVSQEVFQDKVERSFVEQNVVQSARSRLSMFVSCRGTSSWWKCQLSCKNSACRVPECRLDFDLPLRHIEEVFFWVKVQQLSVEQINGACVFRGRVLQRTIHQFVGASTAQIEVYSQDKVMRWVMEEHIDESVADVSVLQIIEETVEMEHWLHC